MTESVTAAVARRDNSPAALIERYKNDFATVLPSHIKPDTWVRLAQGALRRDPKLAEAAAADPGSLMVALLDAARQGLEPGTEEYYLTPRKTKGKLHVLGIRGYQGEIELIYRAGAVSSVIVEVVREKDVFNYAPGRDDRPRHEIDWTAPDRGALMLVYAYAVMKDGAISKVIVLNQAHIDKAKESSQGADNDWSPWKKHTEAMWMKTAIHRLQKFVPTSAEYRASQLRAAVEADNLRRTVPATVEHVPDARPTDADDHGQDYAGHAGEPEPDATTAAEDPLHYEADEIEESDGAA